MNTWRKRASRAGVPQLGRPLENLEWNSKKVKRWMPQSKSTVILLPLVLKRHCIYCVGVKHNLGFYFIMKLARWLALVVATFLLCYITVPIGQKQLHGSEAGPSAQPFRLVPWPLIGPSIFEDQQRYMSSEVNNMPCMRHVEWIFSINRALIKPTASACRLLKFGEGRVAWEVAKNHKLAPD